MKLVLVLVLAVVGCGGGRERAWCDKGGQLCGDPDEAKCVDALKQLKQPLGDTYDPLLTCGTAATSCAEFVGCMAGGIDQVAKVFGKDFERGFDKMTVGTDDPADRKKKDGWRIHDRDRDTTDPTNHTTTTHHTTTNDTTTNNTTTTTTRHFDHHIGPAAAGTTTCAKFEGQPLDAKWSECSDQVRRELLCARGHFDDLECKCLEDGVEKWAFDARDPQLADQAEATRVARSNCHMSFEGF